MFAVAGPGLQVLADDMLDLADGQNEQRSWSLILVHDPSISASQIPHSKVRAGGNADTDRKCCPDGYLVKIEVLDYAGLLRRSRLGHDTDSAAEPGFKREEGDWFRWLCLGACPNSRC